jgi:hypothetical protein
VSLINQVQDPAGLALPDQSLDFTIFGTPVKCFRVLTLQQKPVRQKTKMKRGGDL